MADVPSGPSLDSPPTMQKINGRLVWNKIKYFFKSAVLLYVTCNLFNTDVNNLNYVASECCVWIWIWIGKNVSGSGCNIIKSNIPLFAWREWGISLKHQSWESVSRPRFEHKSLPNTEHKQLARVLLFTSTGGSFSGVKRQGREADHSTPTSAEVKKMWIYTSTLPYVFMA
jgi:hypothetical protein